MKRLPTPRLPFVSLLQNKSGVGLVTASGLGLLLLIGSPALAQTTSPTESPNAVVVTVAGSLRDANGQPLELAAVGIEGRPGGANTTAEGTFALQVRVLADGQPVVLVVRRLG